MTANQFININKELLDQDGGILQLYRRAVSTIGIKASDLTGCFLEFGLNPLEWMDCVPQAYMQDYEAAPNYITIPENIKKIEVAAFSGSPVETIDIREGCSNIRSLAFSKMSRLTLLKLPKSLTSIDTLILSNSNLPRIEYAGTIEEWGKIQKRFNWVSLNPPADFKIQCEDGVYYANS